MQICKKRKILSKLTALQVILEFLLFLGPLIFALSLSTQYMPPVKVRHRVTSSL